MEKRALKNVQLLQNLFVNIQNQTMRVDRVRHQTLPLTMTITTATLNLTITNHN